MPAPNRPRVLAALLLGLILSACGPRVPEVVKIGVVAPFEGEHREIGYDVIPAVRLATREWAAQHPGGPMFEVIAYDDGGSPENAVIAARRLAADPDVAVVIGHWRDETTRAALPVYAAAGLPLVTWASADTSGAGEVLNLAPSETVLAEAAAGWLEDYGPPGARVDLTAPPSDGPPAGSVIGGPGWGSGRFAALAGDAADGAVFVTGAALAQNAAPEPEAFTQAFAEGSLGAEPGMLAWPAYRAAWVAMQHVAGPAESAPVPVPAFDAAGRDPGAAVYVYRWSDGELALEDKLK